MPPNSMEHARALFYALITLAWKYFRMTNTLAYLDGVEITIEAIRDFCTKKFFYNLNETTLFGLTKPKA